MVELVRVPPGPPVARRRGHLELCRQGRRIHPGVVTSRYGRVLALPLRLEYLKLPREVSYFVVLQVQQNYVDQLCNTTGDVRDLVVVEVQTLQLLHVAYVIAYAGQVVFVQVEDLEVAKFTQLVREGPYPVLVEVETTEVLQRSYVARDLLDLIGVQPKDFQRSEFTNLFREYLEIVAVQKEFSQVHKGADFGRYGGE